jgi:hypothetical protein
MLSLAEDERIIKKLDEMRTSAAITASERF